MQLKWNIHSHTYRCHHAGGTEEEMVLAAIRAGLATMGFADHTPMPFKDGFISGIRMLPEELPGYVETLWKLREKYRGTIEIPIGLETEYFPGLFDDYMEMIKDSGVEFLILGQHYLFNEEFSPYMGRETNDEDILINYVDQICEAVDTGVFTYVAHPDLLHFTGNESAYAREMRRLCEHAAKAGIAMELNVNGARDNRHYPNPVFWRIAGETGCQAVIGLDSHNPKFVDLPEAEEKCRAIAADAGIPVLESVPLIPVDEWRRK